MAKVFIHVMMSLDGFIAKPDEDDWDWAFKYDPEGSDNTGKQAESEVGAVVLGNKDFRNNKVKADSLPYGGLKVPQFVVTHHARDPLTIGPATFEFVTGGIKKVIEIAKKAAGDKNVAILGHSVGQQSLEAGLVDYIYVSIVPVLLGNGLRLIDNLGIPPVELERTEAVTTSQYTSLRFRVIK